MAENRSERVCHICKERVPAATFCPRCTMAMKEAPPRDRMTPPARVAEMELLHGPLEVPFDVLHGRVEELVGRPVYTHEIGLNWDGLVAEAGGAPHPTFDQIVDLIPEHKRIIIVVPESADSPGPVAKKGS